MSPAHPSHVAATAMVTVGAAATAVGGLGVGFRAAGFGYLAQSAGALLAGLVLLGLGLHLAARGRRDVFAELRSTPSRMGRAYAAASPSYVPAAPAHVGFGHATPSAARVRVHAQVLPPLALPPAGATIVRRG